MKFAKGIQIVMISLSALVLSACNSSVTVGPGTPDDESGSIFSRPPTPAPVYVVHPDPTPNTTAAGEEDWKSALAGYETYFYKNDGDNRVYYLEGMSSYLLSTQGEPSGLNVLPLGLTPLEQCQKANALLVNEFEHSPEKVEADFAYLANSTAKIKAISVGGSNDEATRYLLASKVSGIPVGNIDLEKAPTKTVIEFNSHSFTAIYDHSHEGYRDVAERNMLGLINGVNTAITIGEFCDYEMANYGAYFEGTIPDLLVFNQIGMSF